jgi:competence protein ComEC
MACVLLWGERTKRRADRFRLLLLTAMALLLIHPFWLLDIGWQLSFATTAGLLLACSRVTGYIPENLPDWIRSLAGVSLTAQIFSLPFVIFYFHRVSLIGIISNLILLPGLETAAFLFLIAVCLMPLVPFISGNLMQVAEFLARGAVGLGTVLAKIPFSAVDVADWGWPSMVCYCAFLFVFLDIGAFKYISSRKRRSLHSSGNWIL